MEQNLDVDEIWRTLKPWGRYQIKQMCFMWAVMLPCSLHLLAVVFIGKQMVGKDNTLVVMTTYGFPENWQPSGIRVCFY